MNYKISAFLLIFFLMTAFAIVMPLVLNNSYLPAAILKDSQKIVLPVIGLVPPFHLIDSAHREFGLSELQGKVSVVNFFFTSCPELCPKMNAQLAQVYESLKTNPTAQIVSISVDPDRDSPEALAKYAEKFGADISVWHFLTGKKEEILSLAEKGFHLPADGTMVHSDKFVLVDKERRIRGYYTSSDASERLRLEQDIDSLTRAKK